MVDKNGLGLIEDVLVGLGRFYAYSIIGSAGSEFALWHVRIPKFAIKGTHRYVETCPAC